VIELLLDKLHEDLNRVKTKPYTIKAEGDGSNDEEIANETWLKHTKRENSAIKDMFGFLMKSKLTCPDCGKVSVSFEYHNTLQIAIPRVNTTVLKVIFIPELMSNIDSNIKNNNNSYINDIMNNTKPIKYEIKIDRLQNIQILKKKLLALIPSTFLQFSANNIVLLESSPEFGNHTVDRIMKDNLQILNINTEACIYAYCPNSEHDNYIILLQVFFFFF
jgi:ubiquitin C-terminal hydrolase